MFFFENQLTFVQQRNFCTAKKRQVEKRQAEKRQAKKKQDKQRKDKRDRPRKQKVDSLQKL